MNEDIKKALEVLHNGGLILYPTDTIWGIGCDALNPEAVKKVYDLKRRMDHKALLVLVDSTAKLNAYVNPMPEVAWDLLETAVDPLTLIYSNARSLAPNLLGEDNSVGIRVTDELFSRTLCMRFKKPIVSTSANISGEPAPKCFAEISKEILEGVDYIVTYRQEEQTPAKPSHIIKLAENGEFTIIR